jgi:hypothetical protein
LPSRRGDRVCCPCVIYNTCLATNRGDRRGIGALPHRVMRLIVCSVTMLTLFISLVYYEYSNSRVLGYSDYVRGITYSAS